jgi:hypothetical protein
LRFLALSARVAAEHGADLVKTYYMPADFQAVTRGLFLPRTPSALVCKGLRQFWSTGWCAGSVADPAIKEGRGWAS